MRIISLLIGAMVLIGCAAPDQSLDSIQESGVLRVGMDASYPPFEYVTPNGDIVGFDVDLARAIADELSVEVELRNISYDGLYDALLIGEVDVLISALVSAPEFEGKANFSDPYFNIGEHLLVSVGSSIDGMAALEGQTLAVEYGSGGDVAAREWERRLTSLQIIRADTPTAAVDALRSGEADAALVDGISAHLAQGEYDDIIIATNVIDSLVAVAVHPESDQLLERINVILSELRSAGTLEQLITTWFE